MAFTFVHYYLHPRVRRPDEILCVEKLMWEKSH